MTSSWIESLSRDSISGNVSMVLKNGNEYEIASMSQGDFNAWTSADSVGAHFNSQVRPSAEVLAKA